MALPFVATATTAHAEYAWVLWLDSDYVAGTRLDKTWHIVGAYAGQQACKDAQLEELARLKVAHAPRTQLLASDRITVGWGDGTSTVLRPICLPDTIDPRGAKGK